ncbi:MAG: rhomboid family intramembrane serine protease [Candidatus Norongarragalinales archaeon]
MDNMKRSIGLPMGDATRLKTRPIATLIIIALNVAIYAITSYANYFLETSEYWVSAGGFVPSLIVYPSQLYRIFSSMFLHADFFHILFNMYFLYLFGRAVENALGRIRYLALYFISGIAASIFHTAFSFLGGFTAYVIPAMGASGAISGILGAYLMLFPGTSLVMGWFFFMFPVFFRLKAAYYLIFWFATQLIYGYARLAESTAVFAHAGGFIAGIAILAVIANKERMSQFRIVQQIAPYPYLIFAPSPQRHKGLSRISKAIIMTLLALLLVGTAYASIGISNQGDIKAATIQYTCDGTPYMDYLGVQLPDIQSQLNSISLDETRILINRLYGVGLLYNETQRNKEVNLTNWRVILGMTVYGERVNVNLVIHNFRGRYDSEGFLNFCEGNLTTEVVRIYQYGYLYNVTVEGTLNYTFEISSQTVNLTNVMQFTALPSLFATAAALTVVITKDKDLVLIAEERETVWHRFEPTI